MGRRKNTEPHHIDICSNCNKEVPYGNIGAKYRATICPDCGKRLIKIDGRCYEVVKLLKEINLKPVWSYSYYYFKTDGVGILFITLYFDMPYDVAMFTGLPNYKFYNKNSHPDFNNYTLDLSSSFAVSINGSALQCRIDNITKETAGVENLSYDALQQIFDSRIKELKDWCEDYKANIEGRWAIGKLAGWLD